MKQLILICVLLLTVFDMLAQPSKTDTLKITITQAKQLLIKQNLALIANRYAIDIADAELIQAKLWSNPNFVWNQDLYSNEQNRYFNVDNQRLVQVEQLFSVSGKHTNTVKLAKLSVEQSKLQVQDVLRSLFFDLGNHFFNLKAAQQKQALLESTVGRYSQLIQSAEERLRVGAMASNEVLRLKSEQIAVRAQATQNKNEVLNELSAVRILLNLNEQVYVTALRENIEIAPNTLGGFIDQALDYRADYLISRNQIKFENRNLKLQRSFAVPDFTIAYQPHDKGSNYVRPYQGVNLEFNIPVFNRNQGNIKMAKSKIAQAEANFSLSENTVRNEVSSSYDQFLNSKNGYEEYTAEFLKQTEELNINANENYQKKNINLLEFIDLQRIYIINKTQYIELRNTYLRAINQLEFSVGKEINKQ
ncbi:MAG: TolC family protein [Cytophagales bacterium]|nr:TolC family protein [Cytophagales bacterium]MCA6365764.1 TolC family protein [Cytophagales bacterium]MCA6372866.1 TolC family protein [Cytophagales bacterium]MCA6376103.1 TolC family protein [Cytophagales bacterium]MCA6384141.1 TolC family protein [Cytophagales bacterium]